MTDKKAKLTSDLRVLCHFDHVVRKHENRRISAQRTIFDLDRDKKLKYSTAIVCVVD